MIPERKGEFPPPLSSTSLVKMSGMRVAQEESFIGLFSKVDSEGKARQDIELPGLEALIKGETVNIFTWVVGNIYNLKD